MATFWIILSCLLWATSIWFVFRNQLLAPIFSFMGLLTLSLAKHGEEGLLPINNTILIGWLCMTLVVMVATILQPIPIRQQTRGVGYMLVGAVAGLSFGLLGSTIQVTLSMFYGIMIVAVAIGIFFGYLIFTNTPAGRNVALGTGNFFQYLLAKGFPIAITIMMMGVVLVILLALRNAAS